MARHTFSVYGQPKATEGNTFSVYDQPNVSVKVSFDPCIFYPVSLCDTVPEGPKNSRLHKIMVNLADGAVLSSRTKFNGFSDTRS